MRKQFIKRGLAVALTAGMSASLLAACGTASTSSSSSSSGSTTKAAGSSTTTAAATTKASSAATKKADNVKKPEKITIMVDGTFQASKQEGQDAWVEQWEKLTGIKLEIIQPDHTSYYDVLGQTMASGKDNWPDVIIAGGSYYSSYASEGALWDMTDAWKNSTMYSNSRTKKDIVESEMIDGHLYGLPLAGGGGCLTYVRKAWLDKLGLSVPTTYDEYLNMLKEFTENDPDGDGQNDTYGVSASGLIGKEAPYINYLPEFYQDAFPSFYKNADGKWVDGFTEDSMKQAVKRLQEAYQAGYIDPEILTNATSDCRKKFAEGKFGAFTYWSGGWGQDMHDLIENNGQDGELVFIPPIKEVGSYIQRIAPVYAITSACKNPEGVFKYFLESIFDDGDMQMLWEYGVKGVHWDDKAETVLGHTYKEGEFHMLEHQATPGSQWNSLMMDQVGSILPMTTDYNAANRGKQNQESSDVFNANNKIAQLVPTTDEMAQYNGDLTTLKNNIIADCVVQNTPVDEAFKRFETEHGKEWSDAIVKSLNDLK